MRRVELLEVLRQLGVGVGVLDAPRRRRSRRRVGTPSASRSGRCRPWRSTRVPGREVRVAVRLPARRASASVTVRSVSLSGATGSPTTPTLSRYCRDRHRRVGARSAWCVGAWRSSTRSTGSRAVSRRSPPAATASSATAAAMRRRRHRISRTESIGRASRVPLAVTTNGRSIRIGCAAMASSSSSSDGVGEAQFGVERFALAHRGAHVDAGVGDQRRRARRASGGVFRYCTMSGSMPLSRNNSSVLRDVEHLGLW